MAETTHKQALPAGHRLGGFRVERVLGVGGFGVTYLAEHASLGHRAAVKEYLPNEFAVRDGTEVHPKSEADRADFEWGLERFVEEARTLARFGHRSIVRARDLFEANRTAYLVMDYEDGQPLDRILERRGTLTEAQLLRVVLPVADGLREVHAAGFLHRDVKPSNVYVRLSDESPVLLDFGAARQALGRRSKSLTAVVSAGYSPPEQYEGEGEQGPWSDIYALSALCHRAITGAAPVEAPRRQGMLLRGQQDPLPRLAENPPAGYSPALLEAVDRGLSVIETERPRSLDEWSAGFRGGTTEQALKRESVAAPQAHGQEMETDASGDPAAGVQQILGKRPLTGRRDGQSAGSTTTGTGGSAWWPRTSRAPHQGFVVHPQSGDAAAVAPLRYRFAAILYDALVVLGIWIFTIAALVTVIGDAVVGAWVRSLLFIELYAFLAFFWCRRGQTLGMLAWRLRLRSDGAFTPGQALARFVGGLASFATLGLGFFWMWFDRDRMTWSDRLSRSVVVRAAKPPRAPRRSKTG